MNQILNKSKITPLILCGGSGTRLWHNSKNHQSKQFIDFGKWTLFGKTLERIKNSIYNPPILSTNKKYLKEIKRHLKNHNIKKYKIILEPVKKNTAPAILCSALIKDIPNEQPLMCFTSDHLIEKMNVFNNAIRKNKPNNSRKLEYIWILSLKKITNEISIYRDKFKNNELLENTQENTF